MGKLRLGKFFKPLATILVYTILMSNGRYACAQDSTNPPGPASPPKSPEVQRLEEEKAQAELRKAIAEANKAEIDAKFPKPSSTPLTGTTTINDGAVIESQMIAYVAMAKAANKIISAIGQKQMSTPIQNLAIYNERDVNLLLSYKVVTGQVDALTKQFCNILRCPSTNRFFPLAPLSIAESFLGGFVDLTAFLRTNVEVKGQAFDIEEGPLVAEIFRAARENESLKKAHLYYPLVFPPDLDPTKKSDILTRIEGVRALRIAAAGFISAVASKDQDIAKVKAKLEQLKTAIEILNAKEQDAITTAQRILETYCPQLVAQNRQLRAKATNASPSDPLDEQAEKVLDQIRQVNPQRCRAFPPEKREHLLELRDILNQTITDKREAITTLAGAKKSLEDLNKQREELTKPLADPQMSVDDAVTFLKAASDQFDKFVTSIIQADASVGVNPLTSYIRAEKLKAALEKSEDGRQVGGGYWLQLKVLKAGGNNRIKTNLIIDIFTGGNRISHSGGAIVQFGLYDSQGQQVASDTITSYVNYIKADQVKQLPCAIVDDLGANAKREACLKNVQQY